MTTAIGSFSIEPDAEPLPGYRLVKRIGSGGYGDVWKAIAPGGIPKAIKIIHGDIDGDRAVRELRSLDRAKSLVHPFLLSIERIEIVDSHLLIVTELADATLRDRFEQCRAEGLAGIPRDELLDYMREAADALDYLFDSHALQHLDIKPENILLRAKHVKVADFGLLKNLQESSASLVSGMTPKYSAPELFEGKPGRHSDQYSLAIVYHEMVSGGLPFSGNNIASLASQHLHAAPDLSALVPLERFAVGKALSKDPRHRFPSCRAFVERLMHRSASIVLPDTRSSAGGTQDRLQSARQKATESDSRCHDGQTSATAAPEIRELPRLLPPEAPISYRPVLFVGIGGTGGRVLRQLRQLVVDRLGDAKGLPAIQFLYVDTDEDGLAGVLKGPGYEGLDRDEIVITPLRQTQDYRNAVVSTLESISRRWIYNVPRSLRTQGLRALGRLAFLDNIDRLLDRIRRAVINATHGESVSATAEQSGLSFGETDPRVFVVASIEGGTGGGMVLDAGYAIRQVLAECGFADDYVCGVLTYAAGAGPVGVAPANAFACLEELRYFAQPGCDYPGELKCGLAGFRGDGATFRSTYLFDIQAAKSEETTAQRLDQLAEYLFQSAVSPTSALLDESRRLEREGSKAHELRLRTAGVYALAGCTEDPAPFADQLCRLLVQRWRNETEAVFQAQAKAANGTALRAVGPSITATSDQLREILKDLGQLANKFEADKCRAGQSISKAATEELSAAAVHGAPRMADIFAYKHGDLALELNQAIERQFFDEGHGLAEILLGTGRLRDDLAACMRATARRLVWRAYHHSVHQYLGESVASADPNVFMGLVSSCLQNARPGLLDLGGAKRLLLAIPIQMNVVDVARGIEQVARERVSVSIEQEGDVKLCYEIEDLPWEGIQNKLIRQRHDSRELAARLHTRINIDWTIS